MANAIEQLLSSEVLSEEVRSTLSEAFDAKLTEAREEITGELRASVSLASNASLSEAFDAKLTEAREEITGELREEFAQRYETDKTQMVEALDAMLSDTIKSELAEFAADKKMAVEAQVEYKRNIAEHAALLDNFVMETLKQEISELRQDRKLQEGNFEKLEDFVMEQLTSELNEFHQDKQALIEEKVRLVKEGKEMIATTKEKFISKASSKLAGIVESTLTSELSVLKEDIQSAKENMFGRKIFETFAAEFMSSHLSEGTTISKLNAEIDNMKSALAESEKTISEKEALIETATVNAKRIAETVSRKETLATLMSPLSKEKRELMTNLLESVATTKLQAAFNKYLPTVLNESSTVSKARTLNESQKTEITGNKASTQTSESEAEIINLKKLAGIK